MRVPSVEVSRTDKKTVGVSVGGWTEKGKEGPVSHIKQELVVRASNTSKVSKLRRN